MLVQMRENRDLNIRLFHNFKGKLEHFAWENLPPLGRDTNILELF
jgi:hypothetical protein